MLLQKQKGRFGPVHLSVELYITVECALYIPKTEVQQFPKLNISLELKNFNATFCEMFFVVELVSRGIENI